MLKLHKAGFAMQLQEVYTPRESTNIARLVYEEVLGLDSLEYEAGRMLDAQETKALDKVLRRLLSNEPVQYILGSTDFYGLKLAVDPTVLIPRPETEELVDWIIHTDLRSHLRILDAGTGSGCIALALKKNKPKAEVWASDVLEDSLETASINAKTLGLDIQFLLHDLTDEVWDKIPELDLLVSNPPYVLSSEEDQLSAQVLEHEPLAALFVDDEDPFQFYKLLLDLGQKRLKKGGYLFFELPETGAKEIGQLSVNQGFMSVEIKKDMQGKERMLKALKK